MQARTPLLLAGYLGLTAGLFAAPQTVPGWSSQELAKLAASDGVGGDKFGAAICVDGDTALVGTDQGSPNPDGEVYVLQRNSSTGEWEEVASLIPSDPGSVTNFGTSVSLSGDTAVVGASEPLVTSPGAAYVFQRDQGGAGAWGQVAKLAASDGANSDQFGSAVSISGTTLVVSAPRDDHGEVGGNPNGDGSVYVFDLVQGLWTEVAKLVSSDAEPSFLDSGDAFGTSVSLDGERLVVGSNRRDEGETFNSGAAYVFERAGQGSGAWSEVAKLVQADPVIGAEFGYSASLQGDLVAIGAPRQDDQGAAYVFRRGGAGTWTQLAKLSDTAGVDDDLFGETLSLLGESLFIGARGKDVGGLTSAGAVFAFERNQGGVDTFGATATFSASDVSAVDRFGSSVAALSTDVVSGHAGVLVGSPNDGVGFDIVGEVEAMAFDPVTGVMYGVDLTNDYLITIDPVNAWGDRVSPFAMAHKNIVGLAFDPGAGVLYGSDTSGVLVSIDPVTGLDTPVGPLGTTGIRSLAFDSNANVLYGVHRGSQKLMSIDTVTGLATAVPTTSGSLGFSQVEAMGFDPVANRLLAVDRSSDQLLSIQPVGAVVTVVGPVGALGVKALAYDSWTGGLFGADDVTDELVGIDASSGATSGIGSFSGTFQIGSVYLFELGFESQVYCTAGVSATGCQAAIAATGTASASASAGFDLAASGVEGAKSGQFFFGVNGRQANPWGNGTSLQCVTPPTVRGGLLSATGTTAVCDGFFSQDLNALWSASPGKNPGAGVFVQAQLWYRDPLNTSNQTTSFSDAVEFYVAP